jgi:hypothetical protein
MKMCAIYFVGILSVTANLPRAFACVDQAFDPSAKALEIETSVVNASIETYEDELQIKSSAATVESEWLNVEGNSIVDLAAMCSIGWQITGEIKLTYYPNNTLIPTICLAIIEVERSKTYKKDSALGAPLENRFVSKLKNNLGCRQM